MAAKASSTAAVSAPSSETTARPRASTISAGLPSPASTCSSTLRAILSLILPSAIRVSSSTTVAGSTPKSVSSTSACLALRAISPIHHLRAADALAPAAIVCSTISRAPALTTSRNSSSEYPHSAFNRRRRSAGGSGRLARSSSTHAVSGTTGTRSGSGK